MKFNVICIDNTSMALSSPTHTVLEKDNVYYGCGSLRSDIRRLSSDELLRGENLVHLGRVRLWPVTENAPSMKAICSPETFSTLVGTVEIDSVL